MVKNINKPILLVDSSRSISLDSRPKFVPNSKNARKRDFSSDQTQKGNDSEEGSKKGINFLLIVVNPKVLQFPKRTYYLLQKRRSLKIKLITQCKVEKSLLPIVNLHN